MGEDNTSKKSFIYYHDWAEELLKYPDDLRLKIDDAIKRYVLYGEEPTDREIIFSIFGIIRKQLDRNSEKWDSIKKKRAEAGRKGALKTNQIRWGDNEQKSAKSANADISQQKSAKSAVNGNVNVNVNDNNLESNKLDSLSTLQVDPSESKIEKSSKKSEIDYVALANFFNATLEKEHSTISRVQRITDRRKGYIESRCREYGKESIMKVIRLAAKSDFLNGKNNRNWKADFDWIFLPNNFPKILEGNYNTNFNNASNETNGQDRLSGRRGTDTAARSAKDYEEPL